MNCIVCCIFNQSEYINMFFLLLKSLLLYGKLNNNIDILVYTSTPFMNIIKKNSLYNKNIVFEINDTYDTIDKACKARLDIFNFKSISKYNKILYLDTDIIVKGDINKVFTVCSDNILYVLEEGTIHCNSDYWGKSLFGNTIHKYKDKSAFSSGILLFKNCIEMNSLFNMINKSILTMPHFFHDQPHIVYNAFKYNLFNNKLLKSFCINNNYNTISNIVIHHFPGGPGVYEHKIKNMNKFLTYIHYTYLFAFVILCIFMLCIIYIWFFNRGIKLMNIYRF